MEPMVPASVNASVASGDVRPELSVMLFLDIRALRNPDLFSPKIPISCGSFLQSFVGSVARSVAGFSLRVG